MPDVDVLGLWPHHLHQAGATPQIDARLCRQIIGILGGRGHFHREIRREGEQLFAAPDRPCGPG
jgi:hypothetical protein